MLRWGEVGDNRGGNGDPGGYMGGSQAAATGNGYRCQSEGKAPHQERLKLINTDAKVGVLSSNYSSS